MTNQANIDVDELLFLLWGAGYQVPEDDFASFILQARAKATVVKRIAKSEALFVDNSIIITNETRAAFISVYTRYTSKRGYQPLIRNDWTKYQRELAQLQQLAELKRANIAMELENIFATIFKRFIREGEFRKAFGGELEQRLNAIVLNSDINSNTFKQLQTAYIKLAEERGRTEYAILAKASLEPFAKLVDLAELTGADLTNLFYAQFAINWGREFPKPTNLHDGSAMGRYADYCSKLKSNEG